MHRSTFGRLVLLAGWALWAGLPCAAAVSRAADRAASAARGERAGGERTLVEFPPALPASAFRATDAEVTLGDGWLRLVTGTKSRWPGVSFHPPSGVWDLSAFRAVVVQVTNLGGQTVRVGCRVDSRNGGGDEARVGGRAELAPGQTAEIYVPIRRRMPEALRGKLFGMRGFPGGWVPQGGIDPAQVERITVYVVQPEKPGKIELRRLRAEGRWTDHPPTDPARLFPLIDQYGQYRHKDWPGKIHRESEFAQRLAQEQRDLRAHPGPGDWNQYGGWAAGPKLRATGRFYVTKYKNKWYLVDPEGRLFWSHGVDCVRFTTAYTPITDREHWFAWLPDRGGAFGQFYGRSSWAAHGYYHGKGAFETFNFTGANLLRKYGDDWQAEAARLTHRRLRSWGLNTIANWSDPAIYLMGRTPYTATASPRGRPIQGSEGYWGKFPDPFDAGFEQSLRRALARNHARSKGDPWCIGFFVNNELSWGDETSLARAALASPADQPAKQAFIEDLRAKYGRIERLNEAWGTNHASWEALAESTTPPEVERAREDLMAFYTRLAEQYFRTCRRVIKEFDPQALYLGCRFAWVNDRAIRAAAEFCDVISFNRYRRSVADLQLPDGLDKPVVIGEFHFGALDRGLFHTGLVPVANQQERAAAYRHYVQGALGNRLIVGTHWFQYGDQATTGRSDGENYQIGLLDVCDTPYWETIAAVREVGYRMYELRSTAE